MWHGKTLIYSSEVQTGGVAAWITGRVNIIVTPSKQPDKPGKPCMAISLKRLEICLAGSLALDCGSSRLVRLKVASVACGDCLMNC